LKLFRFISVKASHESLLLLAGNAAEPAVKNTAAIRHVDHHAPTVSRIRRSENERVRNHPVDDLRQRRTLNEGRFRKLKHRCGSGGKNTQYAHLFDRHTL